MYFKDFIQIAEGKKQKREIQRLTSAFLQGRDNSGFETSTPQIRVFGGNTAPNSKERKEAIKAMSKFQGGSAIKRRRQEIENRAKEAAKQVIKQGKKDNL